MTMVRNILSWYVGVCAALVLIVQGLSSLHAITPQLVPLAGSFSACSARYNVRDDSSKRLLNVRNHFQRRVLVVAAMGVTLIVALILLRPRLRSPKLCLSKLPRAFAPLPIAIPFLLVIPIIAIVSFALGWHVPPNNWDSMTYHLSRAAYWRQWRTLAHFPTNNLRQVVFPGNAEVLLLVTLLLAHAATFAFLVQFSAYAAATVAIYGVGRQLGLRPIYALIGAGAFATMPEVVLQSTSTQNDLTVAAFVICAVYFFADAIQTTRAASFVVAGAALGLAIGTKPTAFLVLPGLCVGAAAILWRSRHGLGSTRRVVAAMAAGLLLAMLLGAPWYIANKEAYGNISGPPSTIQAQEATHPTLGTLSTHLLRYMISLADPGWSAQLNPSVAGALCDETAVLHTNIVSLAHMPAFEPAIDSPGLGYNPAPPCTYNEDLTWFGISGWLAIALAAVWFVAGLIRRKVDLPWMLAAGVISFLLCASFLLRWNPWENRLFIIAIALGSPLLGHLAERLNRRVSGRLLLRLGILYAALIGLGAAMDNSAKPLAAWRINRATMQVLTRSDMGAIIVRVDRSVSAHGRLAIFLGGDDWDYPLFGPHLDRTIEPLTLSSADAPRTTAHAAVDAVLTHQPDNIVKQLLDQQRLGGCHNVWTIRTIETPTPWKLFDCTSHTATT